MGKASQTPPRGEYRKGKEMNFIELNEFFDSVKKRDEELKTSFLNGEVKDNTKKNHISVLSILI